MVGLLALYRRELTTDPPRLVVVAAPRRCAPQLNLKALAGSSLKQNAEILERAIPTWFLWAFIFSDQGDERTLRTALGRELGSKVSYVTVEASTRQQVYDTSFLAPDGVIGTAADVRRVSRTATRRPWWAHHIQTHRMLCAWLTC